MGTTEHTETTEAGKHGTTEHTETTEARDNGRRIRFRVFGVFRGEKSGIAVQAQDFQGRCPWLC